MKYIDVLKSILKYSLIRPIADTIQNKKTAGMGSLSTYQRIPVFFVDVNESSVILQGIAPTCSCVCSN